VPGDGQVSSNSNSNSSGGGAVGTTGVIGGYAGGTCSSRKQRGQLTMTSKVFTLD
jgi:hypothetical protein